MASAEPRYLLGGEARANVQLTRISTAKSRIPARRRTLRGFTLIELAVTLTLVGLLLAVGLPLLMTWIRNAQVRAVADSLQSGIRRAQTDAVRLNQTVVFSFTNATPGLNSTAVVNGKNWSIQSVAQFADPNHQANFLAGGALADVASSVTIDTRAQTALCFNTNGRLIALATTGVPGAVCVAGSQQFDINKSDYDQSTAAAKGDRQLRVLVAIGGQVHMCDRGRPTLSATSPDGCPP